MDKKYEEILAAMSESLSKEDLVSFSWYMKKLEEEYLIKSKLSREAWCIQYIAEDHKDEITVKCKDYLELNKMKREEGNEDTWS